ncbi:MAG TPA: DUF885 domain-containing protein [Planctomycetota bacterium]|nr:DUF885 domain-containing protein [Planctomycetota bacterium]
MDSNKHFETLGKRFFTDWVKRNPILGSSLGYHDEYDELMPDGSMDRELDDHRFFAHWIAEFQKVDPRKLRPDLAVDREMMLSTLRLWLFERSTVRLWERLPEAPQVVGHALFQVLFRNYAPLRERMKMLMKRLEALPKYVEQPKERLKRPVKFFVENELETLTRLPGFFNTLRDISREHLGASMERAMHKLIESAQNSLERYSDWLIVDILPECGEDWSIGEDLHRRWLAARGIDLSPSGMAALGESELARGLDRLKELGRQIKRKSPIEDVRDIVKQQHPDAMDGVLRYVREAVAKAKQFVNRSKFAQIPEHDSMYVIDTPAFLRHLVPQGMYWPPARFEQKRDGYVCITPGDCDSDKLKEHNLAALANLTAHLSYPGRHLMAGWGLHHPSLLRTFAQAPETLEGWALFVEERVKDLGYDDTPQSRFMQILGAMNAGARAILDVKLATGKMNFNQATEFLIDNIGTDRVVAEAEVRRTATQPTISSCPLWGRDRIRDLRKRTKDKLKGRFTELFFNNAVLRAGGLPISALGKELEWRVQEELARPADQEPGKPGKTSRNGKAPAVKKPVKAKPAKKKVPAKSRR